jgi:hypothetical protein
MNDYSRIKNLNISERARTALLSLPRDIAENLTSVFDHDTDEFLFLGIAVDDKVRQLANAEYAEAISILEEDIKKELENIHHFRGSNTMHWTHIG